MISTNSIFLLAKCLDKLSILLGIAAYNTFNLLLNSAIDIESWFLANSVKIELPYSSISSEISSTEVE